MMSKSLSELTAVPAAVGFAVGVGDGLVADHLWGNHHANTIYRAAVAATAIAGDKALGWTPNVSIGMLTAAATLASARIPAAIASKKAGDLFPYSAPVVARAAGCSSCAALARPTVAAQPSSPAPNRDHPQSQPATLAG